MTVADQGLRLRHAGVGGLADRPRACRSAYNAAVAAAANRRTPHDVVATEDFKVDEDGTVHLTVSRTATTLIVFRIGPIKDWAHIERHATVRAVEG